jgi:hypothetical protein
MFNPGVDLTKYLRPFTGCLTKGNMKANPGVDLIASYILLPDCDENSSVNVDT